MMIEPPRLGGGCGIAERENFGVRGRVVGQLAFVVTSRDHRTSGEIDDDSTDGNVVVGQRLTRFVERELHPVFVLLAVIAHEVHATRARPRGPTIRPMAGAPIEVVLFDLGGVLVELGGAVPARELTGIDDDDEVRRRWLTCRWVREFERGTCTSEAFAAGVVADWSLPITPDEYLERFAAWPRGPFSGAAALIAATANHAVVGCLSNTNSLHSQRFTESEIGALFDHAFYSYEFGAVKPDRELFDAVGARLGVEPSRILLLDDSQLNVDGARASGWSAERVVGVDEAAAVLMSRLRGFSRP